MVVKTDKDNKITGHVMTAIKNKHLAVDNPESYEILLEYFKMIKERLDKMQEDFSNSEFDTEVKKKALSKFSQFNKSVYYSVITDKFYIGQFKEENKVFLEDYEHIKQLSNEYIDIDSRIVFGYYLKLIRSSKNLNEKFVNSYFPDLDYRVDSSFVDFATVCLVKKDQTLLPNYKVGGVIYPDDKVSVARTFEQEIQLAKLTGYSSVGEYTRTTTFRNKLKDISKRMTSFTNDFARLTIKNYCAENYK